MRIRTLIIMVAALFSLSSCDKDPDVWESNTKTFNGRWIVDVTFEGAVQASGIEVQIFNTAANNDTVWVSDQEFYGFQEKTVTVSGTDSYTFGTSGGFISNGKVILDGALVYPEYYEGKNGVSCDSIYFECTDEDGTYIYAGHRYTGWEDYMD